LAATGMAPGAAGDMTGAYLGNSQGFWGNFRGPRVVPNPFDNTLIIQSTPQEYESILSLLKDLDVPPRQVLIEAKIYEIELSGAFSNGVEAYFRSKGNNLGGKPFPGNGVNAALTDTATGIATMGTVIGASRELLVFLNTQEVTSRSRVLSAPSIIATDSIPATINVGVDVPTLTSQAVTGATSGGSSVFANTVSNRSTGVTLNITARISPSGIVTLFINQEVSAPGPPPTGGIQSPSFNRKSVQTQVTLQDGDTIAIGGIISENTGSSQKGIPGLIRIPYVGWLFGQVATNRARNELIIFMTPRVIYDTNELRDASEELKARMRKLQPYVKE
jgi:general secretion pathway protein D